MNISSPLYKFLHGKKGDVAQLVTHARFLQHLTRLVRRQLDAALAGHVQVADYTPFRLVLAVDSPAWATRLRFQRQGLLHQLRTVFKEFQSLEDIGIVILPARQAPSTPPPLRREISPNAAESIRAMAEGMEKGPLREALLRLASRERKRERE